MIGKKKYLRQRFASGRFRFFNRSKPPLAIKYTCDIRKFQINGRNVFELSPKNKNGSGSHILYLHGGAYISSFLSFHWKFLAQLVKRSGCTIIAPDYPLAPEYTYKESFAMTETLYRQLISAVNPADVIFMGDSSGGGFALALAQKMKNDLVAQPGQIILLSPWLDITLSNPHMNDTHGFEPFLGIQGLRQAGKIYAGGTPPEYYLLSPINGSFDGLGKIAVFIGTKDILLADARKLRSLVMSMGTTINYYEYEEMAHAWMFLNFPESKKAQLQIINLIQQ